LFLVSEEMFFMNKYWNIIQNLKQLFSIETIEKAFGLKETHILSASLIVFAASHLPTGDVTRRRVTRSEF
jgi:hypothetical protein